MNFKEIEIVKVTKDKRFFYEGYTIYGHYRIRGDKFKPVTSFLSLKYLINHLPPEESKFTIKMLNNLVEKEVCELVIIKSDDKLNFVYKEQLITEENMDRLLK